MTALWFNDRRWAVRSAAVASPTTGVIAFGAMASIVAVVVSFFAGWPLWALVLATLAPWLPTFVADVAWTAHKFGALALLYVLVVTQVGHFLEHLAQMVQLHLLDLSGPHARGVFGQLDIEWVHFAWNTWVLLAALILVVRFPRNRWLWALAIAAAWHEAEHAYLLAVYLTTGQAGTPGLLASGGLAGGGLPIARPELHFAYNLVETVPLLAAFAVEIRRLPKLITSPRDADHDRAAVDPESAEGRPKLPPLVAPASRHDPPFIRPQGSGPSSSAERGTP